MRNRLTKYYKGDNMEEKFGIEELMKVLESADGYMIAISVLKDEKVTPYLFWKNYNESDVLKQLFKLRMKAVSMIEEKEPDIKEE